MKRRLVLAALLYVPSICAASDIVEFKLDTIGSAVVDTTIAVAPGKIAEACVSLPKAARVSWSFEASQPTDFNIHFHEGKKVTYVDKRNALPSASATLEAPVAQQYCWMWTNAGSTAASIKFSARRSQ
jgi:hypothetical protein